MAETEGILEAELTVMNEENCTNFGKDLEVEQKYEFCCAKLNKETRVCVRL